LEIKTKESPELNDELAKEFGFESKDEFLKKNEESLKFQKERQVTEKLHQEILEKIIDENELDVPVALIEQQKQSIQEDVKKTLVQQGFNETQVKEYFEKWGQDVDSKAIFQVKSGLILDRLAKKFDVDSTEEEYTKKLDEMAKQANMELEQVKQYYDANPNMKSNLEYAIREEKTFAKIKEVVKLS